MELDARSVCVFPWPAPTAPTGLTATAVSASQINISWNASTVPAPDVITRYYIYENGNLLTSVNPQTLSLGVGGLQSNTTYSFNVAAVGGHNNVSALSNIATAGTSGAPPGTPNFPLVAIVAVGGDQSYGQGGTSGFVSYTASGPGTAAYTAVQQLGSFDIVFGLSGSYEGWQASGRNKQNLVQAIKGLGTYANVKNATRGTFCFLYSIMESSQNVASGAPYQTLTNLIRANNWWTYESAGGVGTILPSPNASFLEVNYSYAWNQAAGAAANDQPICSKVYGTASAGQSPAQSAATYFASALLTTNVLDSRFNGLTNGAAPNADGLFLDNCFVFPNGGGNLPANGFWDGISAQPSTAIAAYPTGASSLLSRGQFHFFQTMQSYLASCNPGSTYFNVGNFGNYANNVGYGDIHGATAAAMDNMFHGGLIEGVAGIPGSGWQTFMTFAQVLQNYNYGMAYCIAPKLLGLGVVLPADDGSLTATFVTGGVATAVTSGSALEYQMMRCMLCLTLLGNGYFATGVSSYNYSLNRWYDEFGDDSQVQVNVKRGYLGQPTSGVPTAPLFAIGSLGIWGRQFDNGIALVNPWGNGPQTLTSSQLAGTWFFLKGTQLPAVNSGNQFVSFNFADGDGLILIKTGTVAPLTITNVNPLTPQATTGSTYGKTMNATGGVPPYTWSLVSASPDSGGWLSITSSGVLGGTPTVPETESIVVKVTDSASTSFTSNPYTLVVNNNVALAVTTASPLQAATVGQAYNPPLLTATGGTPPYTWQITSDSPDTGGWLSLSLSGQLSGTPGTAETESVTIRVNDSASNNASKVFTLVVNPPLAITNASPLPAATVGSAYSVQMNASGGVTPYSWSITADTPDTGNWLSISSGGALSGTPTAAETESVTIKVVDSAVPTNNTSKVFSLPVSSSSGTIFLQDNYNTYPAAPVTSITSAFSSKGYSSVTFTNSGDVQIVARANLPAGLIANSNFPAGKTQVLLFTLPGLENESRLTWTGFPNTTTRDVSFSWWEYRDNNNNGGEKFMRAGNYVSGTIGGNRGIDSIIGMGLPAGTLTLFANSANMHDFSNQPGTNFGVFNWPSGLHHFERVDHLPIDTSSTYSCSLYIDGVLQGGATGLQIYDTAAQAAVGMQLWDKGGWASGSGTFPIKRYFCAARVASQRQGVWAIPAV